MKKKIFTFILSFILMSSLLAIGTLAATNKKLEEVKGEDGEISWIMYESGELYIYGDAAIPNFSGIGEADWSFYTDKITSITIEDGVSSIGKCAFAGLVKVKSVEIPSSVKSIGMRAFYRCTKLEEVTLPKKLTTISSEAFSGCVKLSEVNLSPLTSEIRSKAFENCKVLKEIEIPDTVKSIGAEAFSGCTSLESIVFLGDAPTVGDDIFSGIDEDVFTVYYSEDASGFTKGIWKNYNREKFDSEGSNDDKEDIDFSEYNLGDANDDGKVNSTDRAILIKYLLGYEDYAHYEGAFCLDLDSDGEVTLIDDIILSRHIAGWKAYDDLYDIDW